MSPALSLIVGEPGVSIGTDVCTYVNREEE